MSMLRQLFRGVRSLLDGRQADADVDDEVRHFIEEAAAAYEADGMTPHAAQRAARLRTGTVLSVREEVRASGWEHAVDTAIADLRYGLRRLISNAGFSLLTIATLALGIGAATAMLSVAGPVLVQTLPYPEADRIRWIWDQTAAGDRVEMAFGTFLEVQQRSRSFESMAVARVWQPTISGLSVAERLEGRGVSAEYFTVFGIPPRMGRDFTPGDDLPNATPVVIISDRLWRRVLGGSPDVIGRHLTLDGSSYGVIGVMPASFDHRLMPAVDVWRPLQYDRTLPTFQGREWGHHLSMVARLRDGIRLNDAIAELGQIAHAPIAERARPVWAAMSNGLIVDSLHESLTREAKPAMLAVVAAAVLLLSIACVNVVNLLLGRNAQRQPELVMRTALGAGRMRLVRQLLTETLLLVAGGGVIGILVAQAFIRVLVLLGPEALPQATALSIDASIFMVAFVVTAIVGIVVGLIPALANPDRRASVPQGVKIAASPNHAVRRGLVVAEVAFALALLVGAGLLFQSLRQLFAIAPGFDARGVVAAQVQVAGPQFADPGVSHRYFQQILESVRQVPGVVNAALTSQLPLSGQMDAYGVQFDMGDGPQPDGGGGAFRYAVSPGYFEAMGIPLLRGRALTEHDHATAPLAAVISESLAKSRFPGEDAIGKRLHAGPTNRPWFTVVGIVGDVKQISLETDWFDAVYVSPQQWHFADRAFWLVVKARDGAPPLTPAIRNAIWSIDKTQAIVRVSTLDAVVASTARQRRFALVLFEVFGLAALFLTAVGIYGVVSSSVTNRIREIGVRTALGASRAAILRMVVGEGASMTIIGIVVGLMIAAAATRGLSALLFGVSRFDPQSYGVVTVTLLAVALAACWIPARRAARIDPASTLRAE